MLDPSFAEQRNIDLREFCDRYIQAELEDPSLVRPNDFYDAEVCEKELEVEMKKEYTLAVGLIFLIQMHF